MNKVEIMNEIEESNVLIAEAIREIKAVMVRYEGQLEAEMSTLSNMQMGLIINNEKNIAYVNALDIAIKNCDSVYRYIVENMPDLSGEF